MLRITCLLAVLLVSIGNRCQAQDLFGNEPLATSSTSVGYIDTATVGNMLRFRFDAGYGNNVPDRAEFFYAKCGCFRVLGADPHAAGPPELESNVDFQTLEATVQQAVTDRLAIFAEVPMRFLNPEQNDNTAGLSDLQAGFKYALWDCSHRTVTFQLRTYIPTGDADRGLGTNHVSLEPGLLIRNSVSPRLTWEAELRDWIPINGASGEGTPFPNESFSSNILRYGLGVGYTVADNGCRTITPVMEFVGWTLFDGLSSSSVDGSLARLDIRETEGVTIVNAKFGVRISDICGRSWYAGYGRCLTGDVWYEDIFRLEYRVNY